MRKTHEGAAPLLSDAQETVTQLNAQLVHVEGIAKNVNSMTTNVAAMTAVVSSTLGSPMIKAAAFTYGVRKTVSDRRDADAVKDARRKRRRRAVKKTPMMRRLFWLAMGVTIGALVVRKLIPRGREADARAAWPGLRRRRWPTSPTRSATSAPTSARRWTSARPSCAQSTGLDGAARPGRGRAPRTARGAEPAGG